jgi:exosortase/archaeosortase family protein
MRQLTGFLALTTAVAYLSSRPVWYRVVIVISALPIALSANISRVMLTGYIMHFINPQFALGTYHTFEGLLMMGFGLLLLQCECCLLDHIVRLVARGGGGSPETDAAPMRPLAIGSS